jgi:hypothetical protein
VNVGGKDTNMQDRAMKSQCCIVCMSVVCGQCVCVYNVYVCVCAMWQHSQLLCPIPLIHTHTNPHTRTRHTYTIHIHTHTHTHIPIHKHGHALSIRFSSVLRNGQENTHHVTFLPAEGPQSRHVWRDFFRSHLTSGACSRRGRSL